MKITRNQLRKLIESFVVDPKGRARHVPFSASAAEDSPHSDKLIRRKPRKEYDYTDQADHDASAAHRKIKRMYGQFGRVYGDDLGNLKQAVSLAGAYDFISPEEEEEARLDLDVSSHPDFKDIRGDSDNYWNRKDEVIEKMRRFLFDLEKQGRFPDMFDKQPGFEYGKREKKGKEPFHHRNDIISLINEFMELYPELDEEYSDNRLIAMFREAGAMTSNDDPTWNISGKHVFGVESGAWENEYKRGKPIPQFPGDKRGYEK